MNLKQATAAAARNTLNVGNLRRIIEAWMSSVPEHAHSVVVPSMKSRDACLLYLETLKGRGDAEVLGGGLHWYQHDGRTAVSSDEVLVRNILRECA